MIRAAQVRAARKRYNEMAPVLDEQSRRRFAALEAQALGRGGVSLMAKIAGLTRRTIYSGLADIRNKYSAEPGRVRRGYLTSFLRLGLRASAIRTRSA